MLERIMIAGGDCRGVVAGLGHGGAAGGWRGGGSAAQDRGVPEAVRRSDEDITGAVVYQSWRQAWRVQIIIRSNKSRRARGSWGSKASKAGAASCLNDCRHVESRSLEQEVRLYSRFKQESFASITRVFSVGIFSICKSIRACLAIKWGKKEHSDNFPIMVARNNVNRPSHAHGSRPEP